MINLLPAGFLAGLFAVGAAAIADKNRLAKGDRLSWLFRPKRERYNNVGWHAINLARALLLLTVALLIAQIVIAARAKGLYW